MVEVDGDNCLEEKGTPTFFDRKRNKADCEAVARSRGWRQFQTDVISSNIQSLQIKSFATSSDCQLRSRRSIRTQSCKIPQNSEKKPLNPSKTLQSSKESLQKPKKTL